MPRIESGKFEGDHRVHHNEKLGMSNVELGYYVHLIHDLYIGKSGPDTWSLLLRVSLALSSLSKLKRDLFMGFVLAFFFELERLREDTDIDYLD